jgi:hypothetical protein
MTEAKLKQKIDDFVDKLCAKLTKELGELIESITLTGSYVIGKISYERPNVNMLIFVKPQHSGNFYLKLGEIIYDLAGRYLDYFSYASLSFRSGIGIG